MRLGAKRVICMRNNRINRKKLSGFLLLLLILSTLVTGLIYFFKLVRPLIMETAKNRTHIIAEQSIHGAVNTLFQDIRYTEFIKLSHLDDGTISAIESDMVSVNRLKAEAAMVIQEVISEIDETEINIPLGSVTGSPLFVGLGPRLPVKLMPYGRIEVDFKSEFTETGINQTRLAISLVAKSYVNIVMPVGQVSSVIKTELPVVQTVIVGKVPDNYVHIDNLGEGYESDVLDLIG